jgi:hypothetical protein
VPLRDDGGTFFFVIASVAKQIQNVYADGFWIASSQELLAMTELDARALTVTTYPRHEKAPVGGGRFL